MQHKYTTIRIDIETATQLAERAQAGHRSKLGQIRLLVEQAHQQEVKAGQLFPVRREFSGKRSTLARY